jgi:hypothetical protein
MLVTELIELAGGHRPNCWVNNAIQQLDSLRMAEDEVRELSSVENTVRRENVIPKFLSEASQCIRSRRDRIARNLVGVEDDGTVLGKTPRNRRLTRSYATREPNQKHCRILPCLRTKALGAGVWGSQQRAMKANKKGVEDSHVSPTP